MKEEIAKELSSALGNIRLAERGVYVQASTLGALEALLDFLKNSKIPVSILSFILRTCDIIYVRISRDIRYSAIIFFSFYSRLLRSM